MLSGFHETTGHAISNTDRRREWIDMLVAIRALVDIHGLGQDVLFHGTTIGKARSIMSRGMQPTDAYEFLPDGDEQSAEGSFWGTIRTAAWYAEDSSLHRKGGAPAIIACPVPFLQTYSTLAADIPSRDFPVPGLTLLDRPEVAERWRTGEVRTWQDSLSDLGSVTALHDYELPLDQAILLDGIESFERILCKSSFSA